MARQELIDWINEQLYVRRLTGAEASKLAGLNVGAISEIVNGKTPGLRVSKALARFFGVPPEHVLRLAGHLPPAPSNSGLSAEAINDLDQIRRLVAMLSPDAQERVTEQLVNLARVAVDLTQPDRTESAA